MSNLNAVESVKKAFDLSVFIDKTNNELKRENAKRFRKAPSPPQHTILTPQYPPITPTTAKVSFAITLVLLIVCFPAAFVYLFYVPKKRKEEIEAIKNSPEYIKQCQDIDEDTKRKQQEIDEAHKAAMEEYNTKIIPTYNQELEAWTNEHNAKINEIKINLGKAAEELNSHYEATKIVPKQYRSIDALNFIYDYISTSDFSIKEAIDAYEKNIQMQLERQRIQEQQYANELAVRQNNLLAEQADLLYEQNEIAEKARRDANAASAVQIAQMHNRNKMLKNNLKR